MFVGFAYLPDLPAQFERVDGEWVFVAEVEQRDGDVGATGNGAVVEFRMDVGPNACFFECAADLCSGLCVWTSGRGGTLLGLCGLLARCFNFAVDSGHTAPIDNPSEYSFTQILS